MFSRKEQQLLEGLQALPDEQIAAVVMDAVKKRPDGGLKLGEAMVVRITNDVIPTPMLGMHVVDNLSDKNPKKPLGKVVSDYEGLLLGGASTVVIGEENGKPCVLLGNKPGREATFIPGGFFNPNTPLSRQGLYTNRDEKKFAAFKSAQESGKPVPDEPINSLSNTPPKGDRNKRENATRELREETGIEFPPEKLLAIESITEEGKRQTKAFPAQPYQQDVSFFLADMRGEKKLRKITPGSDLPIANWVPVTEISKRTGDAGSPRYFYKNEPIFGNYGEMIEKGIALMRAKDFETIGVTKQRVIKYSAARARATDGQDPLAPVPEELGQAAIEWHTKALEIAKEMDRTLSNVFFADTGVRNRW